MATRPASQPVQAREVEQKSISSNIAEGSSIMINGDGSGAFNKNIYNITYRRGLAEDEIQMAVKSFLAGSGFEGDKSDVFMEFLNEALAFPDHVATKLEHTQSNPTVYHIISQKSFVDFRATYFPDLLQFDKDTVETTERYAGPHMAPVLRSLSLPSRSDIQKWAMSPHSQLLWIDGPWSPAISGAWTTDLCLEIMGASTVAIGPDTLRHTVLLYHLCKSVGASEKKGPEIVVQDLISQLIGTHTQSYTLAVCRHYDLSIHRIKTALEPSSFKSLWDLFGDCLKASNVKSMLLVIGDIDCLSDGLRSRPEDALPIDDFINGLVQLSQSIKVLIKILVTAKALPISNKLVAKNLDSSCMVHLKLPVPPNRLRPPTPTPIRFRAPVERRPTQITFSSADKLSKERKHDHISPAPNVTSNDQDEDEDSEVDFPVKSRPDLELLLDSDSGSETDGKSGTVCNISQEAETTFRDVVGVLDSSGERGWVHQDSSDDEVSYSDLEREPLSVMLTTKPCQGDKYRADLVDLLSDSESDDA
ncbi:hypothetical protein FPSE5266_20258 [Fusarium pseudograminearum]|nr:hypothetical protein FPSE5266_20258 [Fusarium pseudograminearum]